MQTRIVKLLITLVSISLPVGGWFFDAIKEPPTHLYNPAWPPHARYHSACWLIVITLAALGSIWLLWGRYRERNSRLSILLAAFLPGMFYVSFLPALLFPGTSAWNDGEAPFQLVAPQVIIAAAMVMVLLIALLLYNYSQSTPRTPNRQKLKVLLSTALKAGLIAGALAAVLNLALNFIYSALTGYSYANIMPIPPIIFSALVPAVLAGLGYCLLTRFTTKANLVFTVIALVVTLLSNIGFLNPTLPDGQPVPPGFLGLVIPMHLIVGGAIAFLIPAICARKLKRA